MGSFGKRAGMVLFVALAACSSVDEGGVGAQQGPAWTDVRRGAPEVPAGPSGGASGADAGARAPALAGGSDAGARPSPPSTPPPASPADAGGAPAPNPPPDAAPAPVPPPVVVPPPPPPPVVLRAKDVKGMRVHVGTIYAKEVQAKIATIANPQVSEDERRWVSEVGGGVIELPEIRADVLYAEKVDCHQLEATNVFAQKIAVDGKGGKGDD